MTVITVLVVIALILFILNLIIGNQMNIEKSVSINKPMGDVYQYLKQIKNQDNFSTWNMADPEMKKEYVGNDSTIGFVYKWESEKNKNVGKGEQEIKSMEENKSITCELRFEKPMKNVANAKFILDSINANSTKVTWLFYGPSKFPMNLFMPILKNMLGKDLQKSLKTLKVVLEK